MIVQRVNLVHEEAMSMFNGMLRKSKAASLIVIQWESQGVTEVIVQCLRLLE